MEMKKDDKTNKDGKSKQSGSYKPKQTQSRMTFGDLEVLKNLRAKMLKDENR